MPDFNKFNAGRRYGAAAPVGSQQAMMERQIKAAEAARAAKKTEDDEPKPAGKRRLLGR